MFETWYYVLYSLLCAALVFGLARVLHWAGDVFLHDSFRNRPDLGRAVARLLDIGFYLVSAGYIALTFSSETGFRTAGDVANAVTLKVGFFLLLLGFLHGFNLLILAIFRGRRDAGTLPAVS